MRRPALFRFAICSCALAFLHQTATVSAGQVTPRRFYPKANVNDLIVDQANQTLYVTSQADLTSESQVIRFDTQTGQALSPLQARGALYGISLSPDSQFLYAANRRAQEVARFDLLTGSPAYVGFTASQGVTALDVAVGASGVGFITTNYPGSGSSQTQRFAPGALTASAIGGSSAPGVLYNQATLFNDPAGKFIYFVESGTSGGSISLYDVATDQYHSVSDAYGFPDGRAAVRADGSHIVVGGGYLRDYDSNLKLVNTRSTLPYGGSIAISPVTSEVYVQTAANEITIFNPDTLAPESSFNVGESLPTFSPFPFGQGRMAFSNGGSSLFVVTQTGVREFAVPVPEPTGAILIVIGAFATRSRRRPRELN